MAETVRGMRILVATDGSESAEIALDLSAGIAWPDDAVIRIVTVVEPLDATLSGAWAPILAHNLDEHLIAQTVAADSINEHAARVLARTGATLERGVLSGRPASSIADEAARFEADLIIVGSRGHGTIGSMLLGSVSAEIVDRAARPVLICRASTLTRIILGVDGSSFARAAENVIGRWPIFRQAAVEVTSVAELGLPWTAGLALSSYDPSGSEYTGMVDQMIADHQAVADAAAARLISAKVSARARVLQGDPATQLIRLARDDQADLIVLGTHGRTGLSRLIIGSVARNVMLHAECSVLVVREAASDPT